MMPGLILPPYPARKVSEVSRSVGTVIGNMTNREDAYDGNLLSTWANGSGTSSYVGKQYPTPIVMDRMLAYGRPVNGIVTDEQAGTITLRCMGSNSNPANSADGDILGEIVFDSAEDYGQAGTPLFYTIICDRPGARWNAYNRVWLRCAYSGAISGNWAVVELRLWQAIQDN